MKENRFFFFLKALCWLAHLQQQMLRNYLNATAPGHMGPVPGARLFWPAVALAPFTLFTYQTSHPHRLPPSLPSPFSSQPSTSPSLLQAPLLLHVFPDLGGQRDGGQAVDPVRSGGAPAEMDGGSGQLQQVRLEFLSREKWNFGAVDVPLARLFSAPCVRTCGAAY